MEEVLSEDELIIMISKGNEEALKLLFSSYEKKMNYEAKQIAIKKFNFLDFDDYVQEIKINFLNILSEYDYRKGKLYSFWMRLYKYHLIDLLKRFDNTNELPLHDSLLENEYYKKSKFENVEKEQIDDLNLNMNSLLKKDELAYKVVVMWSKGYKYDEIGKMFNLNASSVNFFIRKAIKYLKEKML